MTNYYVSSVAHAAVTQWAAGAAVTVGMYRRPLAAQTQGNDRVFKCTTAGTTGGAEPSWNRNNNATTADNTAVWTCVSGQEANQSAGNWTAPARDLASLLAQFTLLPASDTTFVSSDHDRVYASAPSLSQPLSGVLISVSRTGGTLPPTDTDVTVGATEETANGISLSASLNGYAYGLKFKVGSAGASAASITLRNGGNTSVWENCNFQLDNSNTGSQINHSVDETFDGLLVERDCTYTFGNASQGWEFRPGVVEIIHPTLAGTQITGGLFLASLNDDQVITVRDGDLSNPTNLFQSSSNGYARISLDVINCKVPSGGPNLRNTTNVAGMATIRFWNCDDGSNFKYQYLKKVNAGRVESTGQAIRTGGATIDGTVGYSLKMRSDISNSALYGRPLDSEYVISYLGSSGVAKTATIELCSVQALTDADTWLELEYLPNSGDTIGAILTTRTSNILKAGTGLTTSSQAWDTGATARANSHAYAVGDLLKVASNTGRLFYCSSAGTSSGSEPGGYATAVDGSSITDGGATFKTLRRYKIAKAFTPGRIGDIRAKVMTKVFSGTVNTEAIFVDPILAVA